MPNFPSSMPYDDVKIIDQSEYIETTDETPVLDIPTGPVAFCPFISPRGYGEDNKLKYMNSTLLAKYGTPNLKKYGISLYLAKRFIDGGGTVLGMRLMPNDATNASTTIYATIATEEDSKNYATEWTNVDDSGDVINPISDGSHANGIYVTHDSTETNATFMSREIYGAETHISLIQPYVISTATNIDTSAKKITFTGSVMKMSDYSYVIVSKSSGSGYEYYLAQYGAEASSDTTYNKLYKLSKIINPEESSISTIKYSSEKPSGKYYEVFTVSAKAKGEFGNAFAFRLTADETMNNTTSIQNDNIFFYKFIDSENGKKLDENMTFTFDDDYIYGTDCMSADEVFSTYSENIKLAKSTVSKDGDCLGGFEEFKSAIVDLMISSTKVSDKDTAEKLFYGLDILFGGSTDSAKGNTSKYDIVVDNTTNSLNNTNGIYLVGGSDGFGEGDAWSEDEYDDKFASLFADAFKAAYSDLLYDEVRYPFTYIFAPSYDENVVEAMYDLISNRRITRVNLFTPKFDTYGKALQWVNDNYSKFLDSIIGFKATIVSEWGLVKDPYTNKKTYMPSVYFDSYYMPRHWISSPGKPYAGRSNYAWSGFVTGSLTPQTVNTENYIANHNKGINTMLEDGLGYASPYEQITAQQAAKTSALSEINNSITLVEMIRIALKLANDSRWSDLGDNEVIAYKNKVETAISLALTGCYDTMTVVAERETVNGAGRNRIHCRVNVKFKDMLKGISYEFYILAN